jgi:hypothetical protein
MHEYMDKHIKEQPIKTENILYIICYPKNQ